MDSRKILIVTNKMSTVNKVYNFLIRKCSCDIDSMCDSITAGYNLKNVLYSGSMADITIIAVSSAKSEEYKSRNLYDRVIIDSVFEYDCGQEIVKIFEKCARHLYDVIDIDLNSIDL